MRVKTLLVLFALFGILSADTAFAKEKEEWIGLEWRVTQIRYENGELQDTLPNTRISAIFSESGDVTGSAGCNRYFAGFSVERSNIKISPVATTRMLCSEPKGMMEQEAAFLHGLKSAARFRFNDGQLELLDLKDKTVLVLVDADSEIFSQSLIGTWYIECMGGEELLPGTEITMIFMEDGRIAGKATVNNYFASWIESDGLILFTSAGSTMMAGPEPLMKQESKFFKMLSGVRKYKIREGMLILTTAGGEQITAVRVRPD